VIANILCNITKLHIIRPLICMKVTHYTQISSAIILLYLFTNNSRKPFKKKKKTHQSHLVTSINQSQNFSNYN
jgi:hypothetical protein